VRGKRYPGDNVPRKARGQGDEIRARSEELAAIIAKHIQDLRRGKIDRVALAELFTEVALRVSYEIRTPGSAA
jgi:hypothetical protein